MEPQSLSSKDLEGNLQNLASAISNRRMGVPAIFLLEMYKPLTTAFHSAAIFSMPLVTMLVGTHLSNVLLQVLESRDLIEKLIQLLEIKERDR